jgi:hypothetical protein
VCSVLNICAPTTKVFMLDQLISDHKFPIWSRLHGFWRTLPNYNPFLANSGSGQDLDDEFQRLVFSRSNDDVGGEDEEDEVATPAQDIIEDVPGGMDGSDDDAAGEV